LVRWLQHRYGRSNIDIGNSGVSDESATIRIGNDQLQSATFIAAIHGVNVTGGTAVYINSLGQLGTMTSSARFKRDILTMDNASEEILSLRPVTFHYKTDTEGTPQFGLIAEEVAKVNPDLVVRDRNGEIYSVRYEAVNAMLLNEFLKEHRKVEELTKQFQAANAQQQKQIEALTAGLQKVSAQLELSKPAQQTVLNRQ
jgi:predicted ribosome quality control (RQC) complex YloA/Tae2 family protein